VSIADSVFIENCRDILNSGMPDKYENVRPNGVTVHRLILSKSLLL
jgi:hypothetical protein